ncbi:MAG: D-aminoacylase [Vicinamibacteria bacterium]|nr:D-aminoacylase [Vicinamibacteria bacterium]
MRARTAFAVAAASLVGLGLISGPPSRVHAQTERYDWLIRNGTVIDGTGAPRRRADVAIRGDRIVAVAPGLDSSRAERVLDATGHIVAPGFIDNHAHLVTLEKYPHAENFLRQGITTIMASLHSQDQPWPMEDYRARVRMAPNVGLFAGHTWTRKRVMELANRAATSEELAGMKAMVEATMKRGGALGLATGLEYVPASFAPIEEVIALTKVTAPYGGFYVTHMKDEGPGLLDSVRDAIRVGREAGVPVLINHHKATGAAQFGWTAKSIALIEAANAEGLRVAHDLYPYTAFSTYSDLMFPAWALADGKEAFARRVADASTRARLVTEMLRIFPQQAGATPASIQFRDVDFDPALSGKTLEDYLRSKGRATTIPEAVEALIELQLRGGFIGIFHAMDEADVEGVMRHPLSMFETDGDLVELGTGFPHPRSLGSFPRVLGRYVRERRVLTLEQAVRKMTGQTADWWGQRERGRLAPGAFADVVVFDADRVADRATYGDPHHFPEGIRDVIVNGTPVIRNGALTEALPGRFLDRPEASPTSQRPAGAVRRTP